MMMGRDESMPHNVREPGMTSEERDEARAIAEHVVRYGHGANVSATEKLARAVLRYVPPGVPTAAPHMVAAVDDRTTRATPPGLPAAGVICEPIIPETSDGVVEPSDDGEGTRRVGDLGLTCMIDLNDETRR